MRTGAWIVVSVLGLIACGPQPGMSEASVEQQAQPAGVATDAIARVQLDPGLASAAPATHLVLKNVTGPADATFNVYIGLLPEIASPPGTDDPHYVGSFSLYSEVPGDPTDVALALPAKAAQWAIEKSGTGVTIVSIGGANPSVTAEGAFLTTQ